MNNIFKVIWNHATQTWTAVGELASAKGKSKSVKLAAISTALLAVAGASQIAVASDKQVAENTGIVSTSAEAKNVSPTVKLDASQLGGMAISPDRVSDQFKGGAHNGTANIPGATVYAHDGIAIGSGTVAGTKEVGGNGHVAIGLMARANGAKTGGAAVALGAYAVAEEQDTIAIGNQAHANGSQAVSIGHKAESTANGTVAVGNESQSNGFNSTAVGDGSQAVSNFSTALGGKSKAKGWDTIAVGYKATVDGDRSTGVGARSQLTGTDIASLGKESKISSNKVSTLGAGITVGEKRDGAVVLGYGSDADNTTVTQEDQAKVGDLTYSGFKGNLKNINKDLAGRFVSVGSENNERQIKHVAAGKIDSTSTDAINGSQLYAVASGLRDQFPVVYTDADGNKVVKYPDGKYYPEGTTFDADGNPSNPAVPNANVIASMNNPANTKAGKAGDNVTLTNVAPGANTYDFDKDGNPLVKIGDKYYAQDDVVNGAPKKDAQEATPATEAEKDPYEKAATGLANLEGSKDSNALTVADAKKMGWVVSADGNDYADKVTNANEVRFNGKNGVKVTGETDKATGIRNINIELEKSDVVKAGEYKIGDKTYVNIDGKLYDKDSIDPKTNKPKADAAPSNYAVQDGKVMDNTDAANPKEVAGVDNGSNFVDGNTVYKAIQESGWTVGKAKDALSNDKFKNEDEKVNPNDEVRFADGKGITVKTATVDAINDKGEKQTTTVVKFDTDLPIDYANVKNEAGDNLKQANDGKWYKEADVNADGTLKPTDGKAPEAQTPVKTGATLSDGKSNATTPYKNEDVYTYTTDPKTGEVKATPKGYDAAKPENKDSIVKGKDGVQLNNVGWAENPDQAVNKDQLDQTVNKSGFFVQQNGKTTVENAEDKEETNPAKSEKVTPNDVVNFVNGNGTVIKAVTKRDANGVDTTTVSVDVDTSKLVLPKGANTIAYNAAGDQIVKVDGKYYKPSDLQNGKPTATAKEQTPAKPAAADEPLKAAKDGLADLAHSDGDNLLTVKDAQNLGWVVSTSDNKAAAPVKNADVVDFKAEAGTGITVKGKSENGKMTVTVGNDYFKANVTDKAAKAAEATGPNSVAIGGNSNAAVENAVAIGNGAAVKPEAAKGSVAIGAGAQAGKAHTGAYSLDPSATVAGKPSDATRVVSVGSEGNEAQIQNVAAGVVSEKSTDAVNGSQLHATNQSINRLGDTVNNIGGNVTRLSDKVDNMDRDYRAGIAGSNAAASLPQVYLPGKSMVAAAAGTFKGQNALAVGYSSISDNGKLIWKAQANLNSRADVGVGVGMGYLW